jgi:hypothetical protein
VNLEVKRVTCQYCLRKFDIRKAGQHRAVMCPACQKVEESNMPSAQDVAREYFPDATDAMTSWST